MRFEFLNKTEIVEIDFLDTAHKLNKTSILFKTSV